MSGLIGSLRFGNSNTLSVFVAGNYAYVTTYQGSLEIVDISDPSKPVAVGSYAGLNATTLNDVVAEGTNAYVTDASGLEIFDVSNPASPVLIGSLPSGLNSVFVSGNYAYVGDSFNHAVRLVNISDPSTPTVVSSITIPSELGPGSPLGFALSGNYLYVADFSPGIDVIDVTDPAHPALVTTFSNLNPHAHVGPGETSSPTALAISGNYLYVADQDTGLYVLNIANPAAPVEVSSYDPGGAGNHYMGIQVEGTFAYVTDASGKLIELDISDPTHPTLLGSYGIGGSPNGLSVSGDYAYVANDTLGLADVKIGPWSILSNPADVNESAGSATFTVVRLDSSAATTVYLSTIQNHGSPNQGDYVEISDQAITFAVGQATQTVTIQILNDHVAEPDETFGLIVQASANDPVSSYLASTTFTIFDDDRTQTIQQIPVPSTPQLQSPGAEQPLLSSISADGRFVAYFAGSVFNSGSFGDGEIFVYDRVTNTTQLVSGPDLDLYGGFSIYTPKPEISADGRFVVWSENSAHIDGISNLEEVIVYDRLTNTTEVASRTPDGSPSFGTMPTISSDGQFVAYTVPAGNTFHVEIYNRVSHVTEDVPGSGFGGSFSADDRYLAYAAPDLSGIYVYDRMTQQVELVSSSSGGLAPSISGDGRYVAYLDATQDVYVYDRTTNSTELVSRSSDGTIANGPSTDPTISSDGRYIVFNSLASNLVPNDTNGVSDTFVYDRVTHTTTRVSIANDGTQGNGGSFSGDFVGSAAISSDGQFVAFASDASNLVPGDTNGTTDIFVVDQLPAAAINPPPVIDTAHSVLTGTVNKVPNAPASTTPDTAQGTITFTDSDLATTTATVPTATVVFRDAQGLIESIPGYSTDVLLAFQIGPVTSSSNVGSVDWTYSIPNSELNWLGANGTATVTASVQINDGQGDPTTPAVVTVTIHGANDPPVIDLTNSVVSGTTSPATIGGTVEDVTQGALAFSDPNIDDLPTGSVTGQAVVAHDSAGNVITLTQAQIAELESAFSIMPAPGNTNAGTIEWSYALPDQSASFLSAGESATITSTIQLDDHNGGTVTRGVAVTIGGSSDPNQQMVSEAANDLQAVLSSLPGVDLVSSTLSALYTLMNAGVDLPSLYADLTSHGVDQAFVNSLENAITDAGATLSSGAQSILSIMIDAGVDYLADHGILGNSEKPLADSTAQSILNGLLASAPSPEASLASDVNEAINKLTAQVQADTVNGVLQTANAPFHLTNYSGLVDQIAEDVAALWNTPVSNYSIGTNQSNPGAPFAPTNGYTLGFINLSTEIQDVNYSSPNITTSADFKYLDQCLALVQALDHNVSVGGVPAPLSPGVPVDQMINGIDTVNPSIALGTPIATFTNGSYNFDHAAIYLGPRVENNQAGFFVLDQYNLGPLQNPGSPPPIPLYLDNTTLDTFRYETAEIRFIPIVGSSADPARYEYHTIS
jgi:VCBS repeat-containing protein